MLATFERADHGFATVGDEARALHARTFRATGLVAHGRLDDADAALGTMRDRPLASETRIMMLNAEAWLAIDTGRLRQVAPRIDEMVGLLEGTDRLELWYHTTTANRMPGLPGMIKPLLRHADALLRAAGDASLTIRTIAFLTRAWCALFQGRIADAVQLRDRASEDAKWTGHTGAIIGHMLALSAFLDAVRGDVASALESTRERERILGVGYGTWGRYAMKLLRLRIASIGEDAAALRDTIKELDALRESAGGSIDEPRALPQRPPLAELAWLEGRSDDAIAKWRDALRHDEAIDLYGQSSETRVRLARALARQGDLAPASKVLQPVFDRADADDAPGGALFAVSALAELAATEWGSTLAPAQRATLRAWAQKVTFAPATAEPAAVTALASESLSPREHDVLRRIAAGDSNKLIARAFDLSPHTVKRHVANILDKLGVDTRGQAAAWYRESKASG
jgi:LuxR family maltose regulon positive regulatory protein